MTQTNTTTATMKCSKYSSIGPTTTATTTTMSSRKKYEIGRRNLSGLLSKSALVAPVWILICLINLNAIGVVHAWTCRTQERDTPSKALVAPLVFEATVLGSNHSTTTAGFGRASSESISRQSATLRTVMYHVDLRVDKVYKDGRYAVVAATETAADLTATTNAAAATVIIRERSKINLHYWSWSRPNVRNMNGECTFRADLFVVGQKYIVFAEAQSDSFLSPASSTEEDVVDVDDEGPDHRPNSGGATAARVSALATAAPTSSYRFTLFSEPVLQNKTSSRLVRKILCRKCAVPASVRGLKNTTVNFRGRIRLRCNASGNPVPEITWHRNGQTLKSSRNIKVKSKRKQSVLVVSVATEKDTGIYECRATNVMGPPASIKAKVTVRRKKVEATTPVTTTTTRTYTIGDHSGSQCPYPDYCLNGGTCTFFSVLGEPVCKCADGYKGQRCDRKDVPVLGNVQRDSLDSDPSARMLSLYWGK